MSNTRLNEALEAVLSRRSDCDFRRLLGALIATAINHERASIVAYLRRDPDVIALWNASVAIERGYHCDGGTHIGRKRDGAETPHE